jgi:salicylate hydroxylase
MSTEIVVVGGGIGGVATALACARVGIPVTVLERQEELDEAEAGLHIGPNGWRVLADLGVIGELSSRAVLPERMTLADIVTGQEITSVPYGDFPRRYGAPYGVFDRREVLSALIAGCEKTGLVTLLTGKQAGSVRQDSVGATAVCTDGTSYRARAVIGADGLYSTVRAQILDRGTPLFSEYVMYRGIGPRPPGMPDAVMYYAGDGLHFTQFPVSGGAAAGYIASFRSTRGVPGSENWGTPRELFEKFAIASECVRAGILQIDTTRRWPACDRRPLAGWSQGRVTLLGDAAHPMTLYLAQGAAQALEDAVVLAGALADKPCDPVAAFREYEAARFPRTTAVQELTRVVGQLSHVGGAAALLRNHYVTQVTAEGPHVLYDWLYGEDRGVPDWKIPQHLGPYESVS